MQNDETNSGQETSPEISEAFVDYVANKGYGKSRALEGAIKVFMSLPADLQIRFMNRETSVQTDRDVVAAVVKEILEKKPTRKKSIVRSVIGTVICLVITVALLCPLFTGLKVPLLTVYGIYWYPVYEPITFFNGLEPVISKSLAIYLALLLIVGTVWILIAAVKRFKNFPALLCGCILLFASIVSLCYRLAANPIEKDVIIRGFTGYLRYAPTDNLLAGIGDGVVRLYDRNAEKILGEHKSSQAGAEQLFVSSDGQRLAVGRGNNSVDLIDLPTGKLIKNISVPGFKAKMGVFSPDNQKLAVFIDSEYVESTGSWKRPEKGNLWIYSAIDGELLFVESTPVCSGGRQDMDWKGDIIAMVETYDGGRGTLLWDVGKHAKRHTLIHPEFQCGPLSVALSPDGKKVAVGYGPYDVAIWDVQTGKLLHDLSSKNNWVVCLDFSPDGRLLASGEGNSAVRVWDVESGLQLFHFGMGSQHSSNYTYSVSFDSTGRRLACGTENNHIVIYRISD
jgi:hypothetical protein